MRLSLVPDGTWPVRAIDGQQVAAVAGTDVLLAWGRLVPFPDDVARWRERALGVEVPTGARIAVLASVSQTTRTGWPLELVDADVVGDGGPLEHRLAGFYKFLEYGAVALIRARSRAALDGARAAVVAVLASGQPDWAADGTPVCLHDLLAQRRG